MHGSQVLHDSQVPYFRRLVNLTNLYEQAMDIALDVRDIRICFCECGIDLPPDVEERFDKLNRFHRDMVLFFRDEIIDLAEDLTKATADSRGFKLERVPVNTD